MPQGFERIDNSVRLSERRRSLRHPLRSLSYVELDEGNGGIVLNAGEGGLSVQAVMSLMEEVLPRVRFQLAHSKEWVETGARVAWTSESRKVAGLQFLGLPEDTRAQIREWLSHEISQEEAPERQRENEAPSSAKSEGIPESPAASTPRAARFSARAAALSANAPPQVHPAFSEEPKSPEKSATAAADASPASTYLFGHTLNRAVEPEIRSSGEALDKGHNEDKRSINAWTIMGFIAVLAIISLAAGWVAGRGAMSAFLARFQRGSSASAPSQHAAASPPARAATPISKIEIVDMNNQRWTVPFNPSSGVEPAESKRPPTSGPPQARKHEPAAPASFVPAETQTPPANVSTAPPSASAPSAAAPPSSTSAPTIESHSQAPPAPVPGSQAAQQSGVLQQGALIYHIDPVYPDAARQQKVQGTVRLRITIGEDGSVQSVVAISGPSLLIDAARNAVRQWRYSPTTLDGKPVEAEEYVSIVFQLPPSH